MTTIKIQGMTCQHCAAAVTRALSAVEGVKEVQVDLAKGEASFRSEGPVDLALIRERIAKAGYTLVEG